MAKYIASLAFVLIPLMSCTRAIDLAPEVIPEIVVSCILSEDSIQTLHLDMTDVATEKDRKLLNQAHAVLFDETKGSEVGVFGRQEDGLWTMDYSAIPRHQYRLEILVPEREPIHATTAMPSPLHVIAWDYENKHGYLADTVDVLERGAKYRRTSLPSGDVWIMGMNYNPETKQLFVAEEIATSLYTVDGFNLMGGLYHFSDFFDTSVLFPDYRAYTVAFTLYKYVENSPLHKRYLRIPSISEGGLRQSDDPFGYFSISGSFEGNYQFRGNPSDTDGYILFMAPSYSYDRYLKEVFIQEEHLRTTQDYSSLFSRNNVYTNITNGIGIFGAKTEQKVAWNNRIIF